MLLSSGVPNKLIIIHVPTPTATRIQSRLPPEAGGRRARRGPERMGGAERAGVVGVDPDVAQRVAEPVLGRLRPEVPDRAGTDGGSACSHAATRANVATESQTRRAEAMPSSWKP